MNKPVMWGLSIAAVCAGVAVAGLARNRARSARVANESTEIRSREGEPVRDILLAQPFVLSKPYTHMWRKEHPTVRAGWLLVLSVDPAFVHPTQLAEPVLYAGDETIERVNHGEEAGRVIGILPAPLGRDGQPDLDLASTPIWFGAPDLPERIDATAVAHERIRAEQRGLVPFGASVVAAARARGADLLQLEDRVALEQRAALLILEHSPAEYELANGLLVPPTK